MARPKRAKKVEYSFNYNGQGWPLVLIKSTEVAVIPGKGCAWKFGLLPSQVGADLVVSSSPTPLKIEPHEPDPLPDVEVYERLPGGLVEPILKVEAPGTPHEKRTDYDRRRN